ncbi:ABC transporter permease [Streptomyces rubiginosohelvolus]|uniref:ABC transporter permease n=1 Tax=Streptomyces rubiginosohelvolus TaxID=67362 RepID=UPI00365DD40A
MSTAPHPRATVIVLLAVPFALALALWAFAWPAARIAPNDLPVAVAGTEQVTAPITRELDKAGDAFDVHHYDTADQARHAVEQRDVYGAITATAPDRIDLFTASAAAPAVAQLLTTTTAQNAPPGTEVVTTDLVPSPATDPNGSAFASSTLPLSIAGVVTGATITLFGLRRFRAATTLVGVSVLAGLAATAITHSWLGILTGNWWAEAGVLTLTILASGSAITGLAARLGQAGLSLGPLIVVLLGNAWSAVNTSPYLLPEPIGLLGQWLPPGAGANFLRSTSYFEGNTPGTPVLSLSLWIAIGLFLVIAPKRRQAEPHEPSLVKNETRI